MFRATLSRYALALAVAAFPAFVTDCMAVEDEVVASSFGWNADDATDALQHAIDSGAKKVVVDKQDGPWIVRPIVLRGDLELVLQEGVEILAKQGEYLRTGEVMFRAQNVANITIRGEGKGATLRMRKKEYWAEPYQKSEWRHGVSLLSVENVTIENLTIAETGGDGIYLGVGTVKPKSVPCKNITIRNVDCVANNRQGVSVISVDGLLMEDCVLRDTVGTAPEAGIDFEPNKDDEQISNVVMRRVKCINNNGDGFSFYLINLRDFGHELSFTLEDCEAYRNARAGLAMHVANEENALLPGAMVVKNTDFVANAIGMSFRAKWANGAPFALENVKIVTPSAYKALKPEKYADYDFNVVTDEKLDKNLNTTYDMGISLVAVGDDVYTNGGFSFKNVEIVDACESAPDPLLLLRDVSSECVGYDKITGELTTTKLNADGSVKSSAVLDMNDESFLKLFPQLAARKVLAYDFSMLNRQEDAKLSQELAQAWSGDVMTKGGFRVRGGGPYYFHAKAGAKFWWILQQRKIGNYPVEPVKTTVTLPSGVKEELEDLQPTCEPTRYFYEAKEDGWYRIDLAFGASTVELTSEYPIMTAARPSLNVCGTTGTFKFYVPKDAKDLGLRVIGSPAEHVDVTLFDPDGVEVAKMEDVDSLGVWTAPLDETGQKPIAPKSGFWTVRFDRPKNAVLEDYVVVLLGVPALLR